MQLGPEGEFEKKRLSRIIKLQGIDPGFFLLATHSYIESWLRQKYHMWEYDKSFNDLLFKFRIDIIERSVGFPEGLSVLNILREREKTAFAVLHHFVEISPEESAAAAYRLLQFCTLAKIESEDSLKLIRDSLSIWEKQGGSDDGLTRLSELKSKLCESLKRNDEILEEIEQLRKHKLDVEIYSRKIMLLESEIKLLRYKKDEPTISRLNIQKEKAESDKKLAEQKLSGLDEAGEYIEDLSRLSSYTRTRFDFERDITRLTPEQQQVLDSISLTGDFLVKGGAGTGKTLVLIKALEKALSIDDAELSFSDSRTSVRLLTYNRTLAKYDKYLASVLKQAEDAQRISTVDKFLYDILRMIDEDYRIIYTDGYAAELVAAVCPEMILDEAAAAREIEGEIFGLDLSKENYKGQDDIWEIRDAVINKMHDDKSFTKNYSRKIILEYIEDHPDDGRIINTDFIFVDEVQDLAAIDIKALKACSRRAVIMAGDSDQSIYQSGFSFARGGIDIRGATRILRTDFRNTVEIHQLADEYRRKSPGADPETQPEAFRTGPPPEHYSLKNRIEIDQIILQRMRLFIEDLNYAPENICILVPSGKDIEPLQNLLSRAGYEGRDLRKNDFSFEETDIVRISTMHSSKGLDFPVVLLLLDKLPRTVALQDPAAVEKIRRNLIYVSMTRAMDHLNVFTLDGETRPEICDLSGLF